MTTNTFKRLSMNASIAISMLCGIYLLFSVGILKITHLCMGREASVSYFTSEAPRCACSLFAGEKNNCCDNEHELLKLEDYQKSLSSFVLNIPALVCLGDIITTNAVSPGNIAVRPRGNDSPQGLPPPKTLFKIHCSYVFYDDGLLV